METETIPALIHQSRCAALSMQDDGACDCEPQPAGPRHRKAGPLGRFTIHAPEDYRPRHAA